MTLRSHIENRIAVARYAHRPWPLLLDSLRLGNSPYSATSKTGYTLELVSGHGEWFTFYENLIREDYLRGMRPLQSGDHVVDIGANIGAFTVLAARKVGPTGCVHAFEPDPKVCDRLRKNIRINNLANVIVHNAAVGATSGEAVFHRYEKSAYSSLHDGVDGRIHGQRESFTVSMIGIRDVIDLVGRAIALLKVDCEGSEYDIFDALDASSASCIYQVSMEVHPLQGRSCERLAHRLRILGFEVHPTAPLTAVRHSPKDISEEP